MLAGQEPAAGDVEALAVRAVRPNRAVGAVCAPVAVAVEGGVDRRCAEIAQVLLEEQVDVPAYEVFPSGPEEETAAVPRALRLVIEHSADRQDVLLTEVGAAVVVAGFRIEQVQRQADVQLRAARRFGSLEHTSRVLELATPDLAEADDAVVAARKDRGIALGNHGEGPGVQVVGSAEVRPVRRGKQAAAPDVRVVVELELGDAVEQLHLGVLPGAIVEVEIGLELDVLVDLARDVGPDAVDLEVLAPLLVGFLLNGPGCEPRAHPQADPLVFVDLHLVAGPGSAGAQSDGRHDRHGRQAQQKSPHDLPSFGFKHFRIGRVRPVRLAPIA